MYEVHEPLDGDVVQPVVQAYIDVVPKPVRAGVSNFFNNIDDLFSGDQRLAAGQADKAGNDLGRVMINTLSASAASIDVASDAGHPKRQRGLRADVRRLGHSAGTVPVHPVVGPDDGARRHRR